MTRASLLGACWGCISGCRTGGPGALAAPPGVAIQRLAVTSTSFPSNGAIPVDYTCDGADRSPQLTFSTPPRGTQSLAVIAEDEDSSTGAVTNWTLYDLRPDILTLAEGLDPTTAGGNAGTNDFNRPGYAGPCPPRMEIHRYSFRVYALNAPLKLAPEATRSEVEAAMNGHVLGEGVLVGEFSH
jgi:Raf kinase inhibitor-like YbhB/YbcL family protein